MVLKLALSFVASSLTPKASVNSKDADLRTPTATTLASPTTLSSEPKRSVSRKTQQELELDEFSCCDEEEKTQSYQSEPDESESSAVQSDLIEISLGGDEPADSRQQELHHQQRHQHHYQHMRHCHSASDLETIDELIEFAKEGNVQAFKRVCESLATRSVSADSPGYMGWTPAHWAAREGRIPILEYLLSIGVSLDARDRKGDSLLHKAAANGQYRACQWLLQLGFNVQAKNNNGKSALDVAQEHLAIARTSEAALCEAILARENANTF